MVYYIVSVLFLLFFWCLCMAINVSVQYNDGLLPDIILLTQYYFHRGTRLNAMERFCICSLLSHQNVLKVPPPTGGCSEGPGAFCFFSNNSNNNNNNNNNSRVVRKVDGRRAVVVVSVFTHIRPYMLDSFAPS